MIKALIPTYVYESFDSIPFSKLIPLGINVLLCDLDNTLIRYDRIDADDTLIKLVNSIKELGLRLVITSNSPENRVKRVADQLGVDYLFYSGKPFVGKIKKYLKSNNTTLNEVLVIGDQSITDILCANSLKVRSILIDPLVSGDFLITKFNRYLDRLNRKALIKHNLVRKI